MDTGNLRRSCNMVLKSRVSSVSNATWPIQLHQGISTSQRAQQWRSFIIACLWWKEVISLWRMSLLRFFSTLPWFTRLTQVGALFCYGCVIGIPFIFDHSFLTDHWVFLAFFTFFCIISISATIYMFYHQQYLADVSLTLNQNCEEVSDDEQDLTLVPTIGSGQPTSADVWRPTTLRLSFPETPVPVPQTPLIRVLETIDLSSTSVEHFLDTKARAAVVAGTLEQEMPRKPPLHE